jgi:hypothetical protein
MEKAFNEHLPRKGEKSIAEQASKKPLLIDPGQCQKPCGEFHHHDNEEEQ